MECTPIEEPAPIVVDGVDKMAMDLLAKPLEEITPEEKAQVRGIAEDMHGRNLVKGVEGQPPDSGGAVFDDPEDLKWCEIRANNFLKEKAKEKAYQEELAAAAKRKVNLDDMEWGKKQNEEQEQKLSEQAAAAKKVEEDATKQKDRARRQKEAERVAFENLQKQMEVGTWSGLGYNPYRLK